MPLCLSVPPLRQPIFEYLCPEGAALSQRMTKDQPMKPAQPRRKSARTQPPAWADGLKRLYDSVLDEPLPDTFAQLLEKLDDPANG